MMSRLFPVVALIIAIGLFFGYINPTRTGEIAEKKAQIDSYERALAAAEHFNDRQGELIREKANIPQEGLTRVNTFLPDGVNNVQIILDLNTLAARSGVTLSDFDTSDPASEQAGNNGGGDPASSLESQGPVDSLEITLSAKGTYSSFRSFIDGIEQSLRLLDVVSVKVDDSTTGIYTYDVTVRLYWLR